MQPQRFDLKYQAQGEGAQGDGYERPVMVHRAVLGSADDWRASFKKATESCFRQSAARVEGRARRGRQSGDARRTIDRPAHQRRFESPESKGKHRFSHTGARG